MLVFVFQSEFKPAKLFSIDRVFRNENLDATHLAEFHQIEGVVVDYDLSLGDLMGVIEAFFVKLGEISDFYYYNKIPGNTVLGVYYCKTYVLNGSLKKKLSALDEFYTS